MSAEKKHMTTRDIILAGILLAAGAVIRMFFPKLPVTPNFIIAMYCLTILLVRPRLFEALAIGIVAAILSQLTFRALRCRFSISFRSLSAASRRIF